MKREQVDLSEERKIVSNMILSTDFLREISLLVKASLMRSSYARQVVTWILEYYEHYKESPGKNIQDIYLQKSKYLEDEDDTEIIAEFLTRLSEEAENFKLQNIGYSVASAIHFLKIQSITKLKNDLDGFLLEGDPVKAEQSIATYTRIEQLKGEGVSLLYDAPRVMQAFMREEELLFTLPGALGRVAGEFTRGSFVAWLGFMKRGKSWWLWYCGQVAAFSGCRVLFITLEMQEYEIVRRGWEGLVGSPKVEKEITIPYFEPVGTKWEVMHRKEKRKGVNVSEIPEKQKKLRNVMRAGDIRIEAFPTYSATVEDIIAHLDNLQYYDNWVPDVLIVDYADIIKPSGGGNEVRHQLDNIWKKLRGLAQARNISVITASQAGRKGATQDIDVEDSAEDVRKLAHVTKMLVINRNKEEKKKGIFRIGSGLERNEGQEFNQAVVLECLDIGKPYLDSRLANEMIIQPGEKE